MHSGSKFDMDDVWSIKKNVSASGGLLNPSEGLNLKANSTYYSRYGGIKGNVGWRLCSFYGLVEPLSPSDQYKQRNMASMRISMEFYLINYDICSV